MQIKSFIICEDIRREVGNKSSLMGILGDSLSFEGLGSNEWPKIINLSAFIQISLEDVIPSDFSLKITLEGEEVAHIKSDIEVAEGTRYLNLPITMYGFPLKSKGMLVFDLKLQRQGVILLESVNNLAISVR